jgi:hypothetical protein
MMHDRGQSDSSTVPEKPSNNAEEPAAEVVEGRELTKGNSLQRTAPRTQRRISAPSALERGRQAARRDRQQRFTALLHHVATVERLRDAYLALQRDAAPGVDGETWRHYGETLEANLQDLVAHLTRGAHRAKPVRSAYIPKADGRQRPLGVPALEDKLVQRAVVAVLNAIYETDFVGFSYGFRPGRSPHQSLDALAVGIWHKKVNWVLPGPRPSSEQPSGGACQGIPWRVTRISRLMALLKGRDTAPHRGANGGANEGVAGRR